MDLVGLYASVGEDRPVGAFPEKAISLAAERRACVSNALNVEDLQGEWDYEIQDAASFAARVYSGFDPVVCQLRAVPYGTIGRNVGP
jgi:hypothetical protein